MPGVIIEELFMNKAQQSKFDALYQRHVSALQRQGKAAATIDAYSRAVRRITEYFDQCPDRLTEDQLKDYLRIPDEGCHLFHAKVATHSRGRLPPIPEQSCHP